MEAFNTADAEAYYLEWLFAHPAGFVVNTSRPKARPNYLKLHVASCWAIGTGASGGGRLTGRAYQKLCSTSRDELDEWARTIVGGVLSPCGTCLASGGISNPLSPPRPRRPRIPPAEVRPSRESVAEPLAGSLPNRWQPGGILARIDGIRPLLASWDAAVRPSQIRLKAYLDALESGLGLEEFPVTGLYIDLVVDVEIEPRLSKHYDLENYLTPIALRLGWNRFVYAKALKRVGGGSSIVVGVALEDRVPLAPRWATLALRAGTGAESKSWKQGIRAALFAADVEQLAPGPVAVDIAWRCAPRKNWVGLWKPTGDAMGPVLGEPDPRNPFNVADDRIVEISFHRDVDSAIGNDVQVGLAWQLADVSGE